MPGNKSAIARPVGAALSEENDERAAFPRQMKLESFSSLGDNPGVELPRLASRAFRPYRPDAATDGGA